METMKINNEKIIAELQRRGWSKYRLAKELNMTKQGVYSLLDRRTCPFSKLDKIGAILNYEPKDLLE